MFVGTSSGDVLKIALGACVYRQSGPYKSLVPKGVATNAISPTGDIVVGGGDGSVSVLDRDDLSHDERVVLEWLQTLADRIGPEDLQ